MRTSEYYFYHGEAKAAPAVGPLPPVSPWRPQDRVTSAVRNHSWWVSTQLRPQVQGQPSGQTMYSQPSEVRHELVTAAPFVTGELSTMSGILSPRLMGRPAWTHRPSRHEMYSPRKGLRTDDLHYSSQFSRHNLTARLTALPSGPMRDSYKQPQHVQRFVSDIGRKWTPRSGTGREADAASVRADLDAFERALPGLAIPPAKPPSSEAEA